MVLCRSEASQCLPAANIQSQADSGVGIETVARDAILGLIPLCGEEFNSVIPRTRSHRLPVRAFCEVQAETATKAFLVRHGSQS